MRYPVETLLDDASAGVGLGLTLAHLRCGNVTDLHPSLVVVVFDLTDGEVLDVYANDDEGNRAALLAYTTIVEELRPPRLPRPRPRLRSLKP
jgi:hypothetical protein